MWRLLLVLLCLPLAASAAAPSSVAFEQALGGLDDTERGYHDTLFDYVMANIPAGWDYPWKSYRSQGSFRPGPQEKSENTVCRPFHEEVNGIPFDGVACRRVGGEGWCRLHTGDLRSCALEPPKTFMEQAARAMQSGQFQGQEQARRTGEQTRGIQKDWSDWWASWWPF